ncbi:MAG: indole-3-glycerol phosphate synthase TrpC [Bacteroidota bacterium]
MNILDTIIQYKKEEVSQNKLRVPVSELKKSAFYSRDVLSLKSYINHPDKTGIISEFKRKSPSKGIIHPNPDLLSITKDYVDHGASALSILTDAHFFGGSNEDLIQARVHPIPILRKEFIVDTYQIEEAKSIGADAILLIAACLTKEEVQSLSDYAMGLGLEVLLELHAEEELGHICDNIQLVGINNRNLKTFEVDIEQSIRMANKIDPSKCLIAESGIHSAEQVKFFKSNSFKGFLIGEQFMKQEYPGKAFASFVSYL